MRLLQCRERKNVNPSIQYRNSCAKPFVAPTERRALTPRPYSINPSSVIHRGLLPFLPAPREPGTQKSCPIHGYPPIIPQSSQYTHSPTVQLSHTAAVRILIQTRPLYQETGIQKGPHIQNGGLKIKLSWMWPIGGCALSSSQCK